MPLAVLSSASYPAVPTATPIEPEEPDPEEYEEIDPSPEENWSEDGFEATVTVKTPWENRHLLAAKILGGVRKTGDQWAVILPARYKHVPSARAYAVDISRFGGPIQAHDGDLRIAAYDTALLKIKFKPFKPEEDDDDDDGETLIEETIEPISEFLTLPHQKFFWNNQAPDRSNAGEQIRETEAPGRLIKSFTWVYKRLKMPEVPPQMYDFIGTLNAEDVHSITLDYDFAAETLLYESLHLERKITTEGIQAWTATMKFHWRAWTWQKFFRAGKKDPEFMWTKEQLSPTASLLSIYRPYDVNDFVLLQG